MTCATIKRRSKAVRERVPARLAFHRRGESLMKILSRAKELLDRLAKFYAGLLDFLLA